MWEPAIELRLGHAAETPFARAATLAWTRQGVLHREWTLTCDGRAAAALRYRSVMPQVIELVTARDRWHSVRRVFGLELWRDDAASPAVNYRPGFATHRIVRAQGSDLFWKRTSVWRRSWALVTEDGSPLLQVEIARQGLTSGGSIHLEDAVRRLPDLEALVYLAWLLAVRRRRGH
jgi:hypothetical protein